MKPFFIVVCLVLLVPFVSAQPGDQELQQAFGNCFATCASPEFRCEEVCSGKYLQEWARGHDLGAYDYGALMNEGSYEVSFAEAFSQDVQTAKNVVNEKNQPVLIATKPLTLVAPLKKYEDFVSRGKLRMTLPIEGEPFRLGELTAEYDHATAVEDVNVVIVNTTWAYFKSRPIPYTFEYGHQSVQSDVVLDVSFHQLLPLGVIKVNPSPMIDEKLRTLYEQLAQEDGHSLQKVLVHIEPVLENIKNGQHVGQSFVTFRLDSTKFSLEELKALRALSWQEGKAVNLKISTGNEKGASIVEANSVLGLYPTTLVMLTPEKPKVEEEIREKTPTEETKKNQKNLWPYAIIPVLVLAIIAFFLRKRKHLNNHKK